MPIHETDIPRNRHSLMTGINYANALGLADADILSLTTVAGLRAAVGNLSVHEVYSNALRHAQKAVDTEEAIGGYTNTNIAAADTIAGVEALHTALDSSLTTTDNRVRSAYN